MSYYSTRNIKATRKVHTCDGCNKHIEVGSPAFYWAGDCDGEFYSAHYHVECRDAEVAWNEMRGTWGDEYDGLSAITEEPQDVEWLAAEHPIVAERMGLSGSDR
jgi:hypothetical protein